MRNNYETNNSPSCILVQISPSMSVCKYRRSPAVNWAHSYTSASELSERSYFCQIRVYRRLWLYHSCIIIFQHCTASFFFIPKINVAILPFFPFYLCLIHERIFRLLFEIFVSSCPQLSPNYKPTYSSLWEPACFRYQSIRHERLFFLWF